MNRRLRLAGYTGLIMMTCWMIGCSSTAAKKLSPSQSTATSAQATAKRDGRKAQAPTSLEALQSGQAPLTPKESPLKEIYFDFDDYRLLASARETLKADADWLRKNPGVTVDIEGHCDERGTSEYNLALGAKRAQSAKDYLETLGITASRLSTKSYGSEVPVCREHSEDCWQKNRRDRFIARTSEKSGVL